MGSVLLSGVRVAILGLELARGAAWAETSTGSRTPVVFADANPSPQQNAVKKILEEYVRAIETRDIALFKAVKPNLTADEERRAKKAFENIQSQTIEMTIQSFEVRDAEATVKVSRRDTINASIVSGFLQTFSMAKDKDGWSIREIAP